MKQQYDQILATPKPFVKWAGGKRQLIPILHQNLPETFGTYYEPFLGGGALLFHLLTDKNGQKCSISDLNSDLVLAYTTIRDRVDALISSLKNHEKNYQKDSKSYYYSIRDSGPRNEVEKTSAPILSAFSAAATQFCSSIKFSVATSSVLYKM